MEIVFYVNILLFAFKLIKGFKDYEQVVKEDLSNRCQALEINQSNDKLKYNISLQHYFKFDDARDYDTFLEKIENIIHESRIYKYVDNIKFKYWTPSSFIDIKFNHESILSEKWIMNKPLKVITHGWYGKNDKKGKGVFVLTNAYVSSKQYNVITMNWRTIGNTLNYVGAVRKIPLMSTILTYFLFNLIKLKLVRPSDIHILGHSLGAHLAGQCGRRFFTSTGKKISRITAFDPSSPRFQSVMTSYKFSVALKQNDANFVDVIHTAKGFLGMSDPIGHADFYPNNGISPQPGCQRLIILNSMHCSHSKSYKYYLESITAEKSFESLKCSSMKQFNQGKCDNNERNFMGHNADPNKRGKFYLKTNKKSPFSKDLNILVNNIKQ